MLKNFLFHVKQMLGNQRGELVMGGGQATLTEIPTEPAKSDAPAPAVPDTTGLSSQQLKETLRAKEATKAEPSKAGTRIPVPTDHDDSSHKSVDPTNPAQPSTPQPWFKHLGFEDEQSALKSAESAQNKIRQLAEENKSLKVEEQRRVQEALQRLKEIEAERNLSPEEKAQREAFQNWEKENAQALQFFEKRILGKLEQDYDIRPKADAAKDQILNDRRQWKEAFDKDKNRAELWPVMEAIYKEQDMFENFQKNPLPFIEAMAFQKNFAKIAERIAADAVEQYKQSIGKADAAARKNKTELPGGSKSASGDPDVSKMSSRELGNLLPRSENG